MELLNGILMNILLCCCFMFRLLDQCFAFKEMKCKVGRAQAETDHSSVDEAKIKDCPFERYYCLMTTCFIVGNQSLYALTDWQCSYDNNATVCAKETEQAWRKQQFKNVSCKCEFGKYYESMANDKPAATLPTMPTTAKTPPTQPPTETPNMTSSTYIDDDKIN